MTINPELFAPRPRQRQNEQVLERGCLLPLISCVVPAQS